MRTLTRFEIIELGGSITESTGIMADPFVRDTTAVVDGVFYYHEPNDYREGCGNQDGNQLFHPSRRKEERQ